jgi:hypothetical protein
VVARIGVVLIGGALLSAMAVLLSAMAVLLSAMAVLLSAMAVLLSAIASVSGPLRGASDQSRLARSGILGAGASSRGLLFLARTVNADDATTIRDRGARGRAERSARAAGPGTLAR